MYYLCEEKNHSSSSCCLFSFFFPFLPQPLFLLPPPASPRLTASLFPCFPPAAGPSWAAAARRRTSAASALAPAAAASTRRVLPPGGHKSQRESVSIVDRICLRLQFGSVGPMAITLSQSLGQNIGMLRNKERPDAGEEAGRRKCLVMSTANNNSIIQPAILFYVNIFFVVFVVTHCRTKLLCCIEQS